MPRWNNLNPVKRFRLFTVLFLVKSIFSMISFGSEPRAASSSLLILGAIIGALFGTFSILYLGLDSAYMNNFIILAMTGFFSDRVRRLPVSSSCWK